MPEKTLEYRGKGILVRYAVRRCIHAAECVRGLPEVFDPQRKPWIEPDAADVERVAGVIERCPTGALTYERLDGLEGETVTPFCAVRVEPDGPLYLRGDLRLNHEDGASEQCLRLALCRCGASGHKPFCDGSHERVGFVDPGRLAGDPAADAEAEPSPLTLTCRGDGPVLFKGPVQVEDVDGTLDSRSEGAFCRCGASANKPYCDGSHQRIGFKSGA